MDRRRPAPESARLRQLGEELRRGRPRSAGREVDPARLSEGWPPEIRRRRLVEAVDRELDQPDRDEDARPPR
jgi:hypothetical protein